MDVRLYNTMNELIEIYQRIAPELMSFVEERYSLLSHISHSQPVGRRMLSTLTDLSERVVRSHVEFLKDNGLVEFTQQGMVLTDDGVVLLPKLGYALYELNKINELEDLICKALHLNKVIISSGNGQMALKELGFRAAQEIQHLVQPRAVVAVSGGSTLAAVANNMAAKNLDPIVIPARGGIGERVEYQANVIASVLADKWHGTYKMLHLPDGLSQDSLRVLLEMEPQIKEINELAYRTDVLIFGIGRALHMAEQRHISDDVRCQLKIDAAVGEALGHYCTVEGRIVYATNNIGISLEQVNKVTHIVAVAAGFDKAEAIIGVMRACKKGILIIDEQAAAGIVQILKLSK